MKTQEKILGSLWNMFNKLIWINEYDMKKSLESYKPSEIHCIEYIGKNEDANVTKLSKDFNMTRGAISKLTKKLITKGLIESYQKPENKKEIYYKLTKNGEEVFDVHKKLHIKFIDRDKEIFEKFSSEELETIIKFAEQYDLHLKSKIEELGIGSKSGGLDKF